MSAVLDLSRLPPPDVIEPLDYEEILAEVAADFSGRNTEFSAWVESEPTVKLMETMAYRERLLRQRINDAGRALLLPHAEESDLDNLVSLVGIARLAGESDDRLRRRAVLGFDGFATAGSAAAYRFHALSADAAVRDASATSPSAGAVTVTVLGGENPDGAAGDTLVDAVEATLTGDRVKPMTDVLTVQGAEIVPYTIAAALTVASGPGAETVRLAAEEALTAHALATHRLGATVARSRLIAEAHVAGVENVLLTSPSADVTATKAQAPWPTAGASAAYSAPDTHDLGGIAVTVA